jgi:hypothetical protein
VGGGEWNVHAFFAEDIVSIQQNVFRIKKLQPMPTFRLCAAERKKKEFYNFLQALRPYKSEDLLSMGVTVARAQYNFLIVVARKALMLPGCVCVCVCVCVCHAA